MMRAQLPSRQQLQQSRLLCKKADFGLFNCFVMGEFCVLAAAAADLEARLSCNAPGVQLQYRVLQGVLCAAGAPWCNKVPYESHRLQ
jgi:hypothetical protein